jgi:hypothetical protein
VFEQKNQFENFSFFLSIFIFSCFSLQNQLKDITKVLGLEETILIKTPKKFEAPNTLFDYEGIDEAVRKAPVAPGSPLQCVSLRMLCLVS